MSQSQVVKILYVEDDPGTARLFQKTLARLGYAVDLAADGEEGLHKWLAGSYDLLATDHDMPKMKGLELIREVASRGPLPPTVMITGHGNETVAVEAMKLGADDYILKDSAARYLELVPQSIEQALTRRRFREEKLKAEEDLRVHRIELEIQNEELRQAQIALEELKDKYLDLYDLAPVGYVTLDEKCLILEANLTAAQLLGVERRSLISMFLSRFVCQELGDALYLHLRQVFETRSRQTFEIELARKDGTRFHAQLESVAVQDETGQSHRCRTIVSDITERKRMERLSHMRLALLEFAASHSLGELLQKTLDEISALTDSSIGFYHFVESDQETLLLQAWSTRTVKEFCKAEGEGQHYRIDQAGVWVDCVHERKPVIHNDYASLPHRKGIPEGHAHVIRELAVPIIKSDRIVAVLGVGNKPTDYTEKDVEVVSYLADVTWEIAKRKEAEEALRDALFSLEGSLAERAGVNGKLEREIQIHQESQARQNLALEILRELNEPISALNSIESILEKLKEFTEVDAVAIRLRESEDFPYFVSSGFPDAFVEAEKYLCARDTAGEIIRDSDGNPCLECMCGNIIMGRTDPSYAFFTEKGSFWSNCTTELLASTTDEDRQTRTRNRCISDGYESVALIPLNTGDEVVGLLQFNDRRTNRFTLDMIHFLEEIGAGIGIALTRNRMREAMLESLETVKFERAQLLSIFESINEVCFVSDPRTYEILYANKCAEGLYGRDLIGRTCYKKFRGFDNPCKDCTNERVIELQGKPYQWEYCNPVLKKAFFATARMIRWPDGRDVRFQFAMDATERERAEQDRENLRSQLLQAQKMESIGTLAGGIAHDFNNLLFVIMGNAELAMKSNSEPEAISEYLQEIWEAATRSKRLVEQILAFSRRTEQEKTAVSLESLVKETVKFLRSSLPTTIEVRQRIQRGLPQVWADPTRLHQVLMNLCTNAAHAMRPQGGILEVRLAKEKIAAGSPLLKGGMPVGPYIRLTVKDTGAGIDPGDLPRIFEPYFTTKGLREGTGLGLAVVHGIVKAHGGMVTVDSEPNNGSEFHVFLPAIPEEVDAEKTEAPSCREVGPLRVLLVDDEVAVARVYKGMAEKLGHCVILSNDGHEALDLLSERPDAFDLLITDMTMPRMTGAELSEKVLALRPDMPIIVCTGFSEQIDRGEAERRGIRGFLFKPFTVDELAHAIDEICEDKVPQG